MLYCLPDWIRHGGWITHLEVALVLVANALALVNAVALMRRATRTRATRVALALMPALATTVLAVGLSSQFLWWWVARAPLSGHPLSSREWCFATADEILDHARLALAGAILPVGTWVVGGGIALAERRSQRGPAS
jgi:hypothetical protein